MTKLLNFGRQPLYWLGMLALGAGMEATALVYQHLLDYPPCVMCIHVRIWVVVMMLVAVIGLLLCRRRVWCALAHLLMGGVMLGLLERAWQLLGTERGFIISTCGFDLGLPAWLALDRWLPAVFEVQTTCGYTPELLFGITTAEMLLVISAGLSIISLAFALATLLTPAK